MEKSIMSKQSVSQVERENIRLKAAVEELSILNEIAAAINSSIEVEQIVELMIKKCVKHLKVEQAAVMLLDEKLEQQPFHTMIRQVVSSAEVLPYRFDNQLSGWMLKNQKPLLINDFAHDNRFVEIKDQALVIRSLLSVPLLSKGKMIGVLSLFNKKSSAGFSSQDQRLVTIIASQSAQVIENARLYQEEQKLLQVQKELMLALEIQSNLLPKRQPVLKNYDIFGKSIPAQTVGGDYFDFIPLDQNCLAICLGDVSGKGLPAAMLMANLQATVRGQTTIDASPGNCLKRSNKLLYLSTDRQKFATLFYGVLDTTNHKFCFANAGHNRPLFVKKGRTPICLETAGMALSILDNSEFKEDCIVFSPGDSLLIFSDGITEAMNFSGEEFGEDRVADLFYKNQKMSAKDIVEKIITSVDNYSNNEYPKDDMTLIVIKRRT
ncbi:MAG: GAF domain-containing SpoIIE family protein phosphatase [bacterium]|nr:GAF domain-containing SpoIIE family protein phosphatase [bacterium]